MQATQNISERIPSRDDKGAGKIVSFIFSKGKKNKSVKLINRTYKS